MGYDEMEDVEEISIKDLDFKTVNPMVADTIRHHKGIFGGDKKRFADSIRKGKTLYYPVNVDFTSTEYVTGLANTGSDALFCELSTRDGIKIKEKIFCSPQASFYSFDEFNDYFDDEDEALAEMKAEEVRNRKHNGYIVRYVLSGIEHYIVVDENEFKDFNITLSMGSFFISFESVK